MGGLNKYISFFLSNLECLQKYCILLILCVQGGRNTRVQSQETVKHANTQITDWPEKF